MTTDWDGQGLPPAALARMERGRSSAVRSSLLSVPGHVGVEAGGFSVVGEVMGCIVETIGFTGWAGCGYGGYGLAGGGSMFGGLGGVRTVTSGQATGWVGYAPYVDALYHGFDTALYRMLLECQSLGGDGVVGVRLEQRHLGQGNREFVALGTAIRAAGGRRPARLFSTTLNGQDFAKLLQGGWIPASVVVGISVAIRHDDWATRSQASAWTYNTEVSGYTELVNHVRADSRTQLARRVVAIGADGAITSTMQLNIHAQEVGENHTDHVAESRLIGDAIVRFHAEGASPTTSLKILPLSSPQGSKR
ncbi:MAG: heavy metal-binding domain-containing protein [Acidimicrobiales bacterium]